MSQLTVNVRASRLVIARGTLPSLGGAGSVADGDKGDVIVADSGATWTIDPALLTTFGRTLTAAADAAAVRTLLGLGTAALDKAWTYAQVAADWANTDGVLTDVTGLAFTPGANKLYEVEAFLAFVTAATTTGLQWCFTAPGSLGTGTTWSTMAIDVPTSINARVLRNAQLGVAAAGTGVTSTAFEYLARGSCLVKTGTGPSGDLKIQANTEVAASAVTIRAGSFLRYREVP